MADVTVNAIEPFGRSIRSSEQNVQSIWVLAFRGRKCIGDRDQESNSTAINRNVQLKRMQRKICNRKPNQSIIF